ncbi:uncharacterized protein HME9302_01978 [Alteripontixanthobacter maritimus]|uniref:Small-conductance mechanosensitive channel n=1 Tax=Alteripontixanthobacter maritimus TaxID=2161824 RepID=A0A369Q8F9_9SPHN|nr:mechanosensitive ion channel [Alteripontixanthobacter maritimus]RDC60762.1 uncharacterized protein HME9302_01978 [Alteripontixanthobacter maritimus]
MLDRYRFDQDVAMNIAEKALYAIGILIVTWVLAKIAKWAFAKLVDNVAFFQRGTASGASIGTSLGKIVSLLIWLFGLIAILNVLGLGVVGGPINSLLENIVDFIPNLIGAGLIFFIGLMVARIARDLVVTTMQTLDVDRWANRGGVDEATGNTTISKTIGTIVYVLIVIPVAIAALEALDIASISGPASNMLNMILSAIPNIIAAAVLLGIGYVISRFVVQILKEVLPGLGVDRAMASAGFVPETTSASNVLARIAQIAIMLVAAIAATRALGFPELTLLLGEILELGGQVIFGAVVIGVGFMLANLLARMISDTGEPGLGGIIVKYATIVLFTFMGLSFMGVGDEIVQMAFAALVIGGAVAAALAFGLGGREWAGRKLEQIDDKAKEKVSSSGSGNLGSTTAKPAAKPVAPKSDKPLPPGA